MPSAASKAERKLLPRLTVSVEQGSEIIGVLLVAITLLLVGSLISYHPDDPSLLTHSARSAGGGPGSASNLVGPFGANLAAILFASLGLASWAVPIVLLLMAWRRFRRLPSGRPVVRWIGLGMLALAVPSLLELTFGEVAWRAAPIHAGGLLGALLAAPEEIGIDPGLLVTLLNRSGAFVVLVALAAIGVNLAGQSTMGALIVLLKARFADLRARFDLAQGKRREQRDKEAVRARVVSRHLGREEAPRGQAVAGPARVRLRKGAGQFAVRRVAGAVSEQSAPAGFDAAREAPDLSSGASTVRAAAPRAEATAPSIAVAERSRLRSAAEPRAASPAPAVRKRKPKPAPEASAQASLGFQPGEGEASALPPLNLLDLGRDVEQRDERQLVQQGETIESACREFGVDGTVVGIEPGPVITVSEFQPAAGVKVSRVVGLQDDLALALKAESVRIDRMPGRSTMGIEVPNNKRSIIHLGTLLDDDKFRRAPSPLTMALGVDIHGRPQYSDLATMPHLLVAGATGAGKSVGLQTMITSIIYKATKDDVKFIFIDPKRIELGVYADIPHLKTEVVVEPKKAANALRWAVSEMERRYRLLAEVHVRSIAFYNQAIRDPEVRKRLSLAEADDVEVREDDLKALPYYVIIIDELADLMMVSASEVETSIARLAQMARAVGIHLIIATQRPSVDVLTGTIKANFPCRLSYATASRHDSRTILDHVGAEKLLGRGDALFMPPGTSRIQRLHGAYISEQETAGLIRWLKRHGKPDLDPDVVKDQKESASEGAGSGGQDDELFDEAARLVIAEGQGSASFLQRRMRVGFSRAARLIDIMERDGLLGPSQGSKPREVLVKPDFFEEIDHARAEE